MTKDLSGGAELRRSETASDAERKLADEEVRVAVFPPTALELTPTNHVPAKTQENYVRVMLTKSEVDV
ncbi:hypothetical protein PRIPAC_72896 [Pristionchus pacificus]|uniref:Uncharacterized protein n=1 Tax=Pristionchus pacificus TaxID=54126 RepID=A0A2A6C512_PRIPA|nr:hypothetical protein PRIPAC_72896 [Pristionchus pacificus]|eukprot:PDM73254.1 hypothetical protein PRIPAC_40610 [Pristionchus pacificus]